MKTAFSLFLLMSSYVLMSQPKAELSNPIKLSAKTNKFKVIGKNNDGTVVRLYGTEDVIHVYDSELRLVTSKTISFKNKDGLLQHVMLNKTGAVIFFLQQDRKYSVLYAQPVNSKFMEIGEPILIDSILDRKELVASNLRFKSSADQSSLLIYYPFFSFQKVDLIKFICVDRGLKTQYNQLVPVGRSESELEGSKTLVDNQGNALMMLKPDNKKNFSQYDVLRLSNKGDFSSYSINTDKQLFGEPWFEVDNKNGNLIMSAFYDDKLKPGEDAASGFLFASFDPANGTALHVVYSSFSKNFVSDLTGRENVTNTSLYTFNIRKAILRNDGGALVIAESFIKDSREQAVPIGIQPGYNSFRTSDIFQFNDIIAFSFNPKGEVEWNATMRKKQVSEDDNGAYSSFLVVNEKDQLHFVYLDEASWSGVLNEYTLTSTGSSNRRVILSQEEKDLLLMPKMGKQISPTEAVIPSYKSGVMQILKLSY